MRFSKDYCDALRDLVPSATHGGVLLSVKLQAYVRVDARSFKWKETILKKHPRKMHEVSIFSKIAGQELQLY